jgi:hypothetical protein
MKRLLCALREIRRPLAGKAKAGGLAVPGMAGSASAPCDAPLVLPDGRHTVYARYGRN